MTVTVNQDISPFAYASGSTENSNCCSKSINVCDLMPHDHNIILGIDNLQKSLSLDTGAYTGTLFNLLGFTAVIRNGGSILYNCLISATAKSQVDCRMSKRIIFLIILAIRTDTDT